MRIRDLFLKSTDLSTGVLTGCVLAVLQLGLWVGLASLTRSPLIMILAAGVGIALSPVGVIWTYNQGIINIPSKHRALLKWFGERQKGAEYELHEGDHWIWKWFGAMGYEEYNMQEKTDSVDKIPIETADGTRIPTDLSIQWRPRAGMLYYYGDIADIVKAFSNEVRDGVRAFGVSRTDLEHLTNSRFAEALKELLPKYLQLRADGVAAKMAFTETDDGVLSVSLSPIDSDHPVPPWGIDVSSVVVTDFELPSNYTEAASEIAEAKKRRSAVDNLSGTFERVLASFLAKGVDTNVAMAAAHTIVTPDRETSLKVHAFAGLDHVAETVTNAVLVGLGRQPVSPAQKPEPSPQAKEDTDVQP